MPRRDWKGVNQIQIGDMVEIDLRATPVAGVERGSRVEAAVAVRRSESEVVIEIYRHDPEDYPKPINLDRYCVWEHLPSYRDYLSLVNLASTEDNPNMRGFLDDHVFLIKEDVHRYEHRLPELPAQVRALIARKPV